MKILFIFSLLFNFVSFENKINKNQFNDFIKFSLLILLSSVIYLLSIGDISYGIWLLRESVLIIFIMFILIIIKAKIKMEIILIYFLFSINFLHIIQSVFSYKIDLFYNMLGHLLLPGTAKSITVYSTGLIGHVIYDYTGVYINRINILFDQPSTYFILTIVLSFVLLFKGRNKFSLIFLIFGFLASPTKIGVVMVPLFILYYYFRNSYYFEKKIQYLSIAIALFIILILPPIIGYIGSILYGESMIFTFDDSVIARMYWTWLYGNGYMPWEIMNIVGSNGFVVYDGISAKLPLLFAAIISWFIAPTIRYFSISLILTFLFTIQYGIAITTIWIFLVLSITLKYFLINKDYRYITKEKLLNLQ